MNHRKLVRKSWTAMAVAIVAGCSSVGGGGTPMPRPERVQGTLGGVVIVEGTEIEGLLELSTASEGFQARFHSESFGFEASGEGRLDGGRLRLELEYDVDCPGELRMLGPYDAEGGRWSGELVASDCTGDAEGSFRFVRRTR